MMKARFVSVLVVMCVGLAPARSYAQLLSAKEGPNVYGHHHLNVTSVEEHKKFFVDGLGGVPSNVEGFPGDVVKFPNVLVMLRQAKPTSGTKGTSVDHIGFQVPNLRATIDKLKAMGYPIVTQAEIPPQFKITNGVAFIDGQNVYTSFVMGPDQLKVEIFENKEMKQPVSLHHVHFYVPDPVVARDWYVKVFGARPGKRGAFDEALLPGVRLTFSKSETPVIPTKGTVVDHIGFEIRGLKDFTEKEAAAGVKFDRPFAEFGPMKLGFTFLVDPWGTNIELNEGLPRIFP